MLYHTTESQILIKCVKLLQRIRYSWSYFRQRRNAFFYTDALLVNVCYRPITH